MSGMIMRTLMEQEAFEAPLIVAKQLQENQAVWTAVSQRLHKVNPPFAVTIARGSSDHAATFAKYLLEVYLGLATSSAAPSVCTLYNRSMKLKDSLVLALSQSGQSPDICEMLQSARKAGAVTVAIVNQVNSPLADIAEYVVPIWAGSEQAVAATKSYIGMLAALIQFLAIYLQESELLNCVAHLPEKLQKSLEMDWSSAVTAWKNVHDTLVLGRGFGFPIAQEAALKFKETASLHAEAFSSAEVLHGPLALVKSEYPVLFFTQNDATLPGTLAIANKIADMGGNTWLSIPSNLHHDLSSKISLLPLPESIHPLIDVLMQIQAFYPMMAKLALARGFNPDKPQNLQKVTQTR